MRTSWSSLQNKLFITLFEQKKQHLGHSCCPISLVISNMIFNRKLSEQFWRIWCFPIQSDRSCTWMPERRFKDGHRVTWLVLKRLCFGPLSNSPVIFLHSPGKTLLTLSLVQKWLGSPFPEDIWAWWLLMHWLQLQSTPCEALTSVWISFAWQYSQACCHPCCLCTFSYPNSSFQSTLHLICFDTALCKQPHLSVMTSVTYPLCGGRQCSSSGSLPSQQSSPLLWFQRTRDTWIYTVWMVINWNSNVNILIFWEIFDFHEL